MVIYRAKYPLEKSALIFTHTSYLAQIPTGKWSCTLLHVCPIRIWRALCLTFQPVKSVNLGIFELTPVDFVNKAFCSNGQISGKSKTMFVPSSYANSFATFGNLWVISSLSRTGARSFKGGAVKPAQEMRNLSSAGTSRNEKLELIWNWNSRNPTILASS